MQSSKGRLGKFLLVLGISAWVPYIILQVMGDSPNLLPFLTVHLVGVVGGARLKREESNESLPTNATANPIRRRLSNALLAVGIVVWVPYSLMKGLNPGGVVITPYLIVHLSAIFGGVLLRLDFIAIRLFRETKAQLQDGQ